MPATTTPSRQTARTAGLLYLLMVLTGPFVLIVVPGRLFVPHDATATAANILAHQSLFEAYIVVGLVSELAFIAVALVLYRLFREVSGPLATAMVVLVLVDAPLAFFGVANEVAALAFLRGGGSLAVFDQPQRDALALFLLSADQQGLPVAVLFWGLWLLPLGCLAYRSGFVPRLLGGWLFVNGLTYVAVSATGLFAPAYLKAVSMYSTPLLLGEVAFTFWLLVWGARTHRPSATPAVAGG